MTAPGAAKTNPKSEHIRASIKPVGHMEYSAKQPNLLAGNEAMPHLMKNKGYRNADYGHEECNG